jgi:hypothetical protein
MKLDRLRWILLPVAAVALLVVVFKGATPGRLALAAICSLVWYGLSRRKTFSLDRDRFANGKLGRRSS